MGIAVDIVLVINVKYTDGMRSRYSIRYQLTLGVTAMQPNAYMYL